MKIKTGLIIVFAIIIVVFTLQNTEIVSVKLWFWEVKTSRALLIISSVAAGALFGMLLPPLRKSERKEHNLFKTKSEGKESITEEKE